MNEEDAIKHRQLYRSLQKIGEMGFKVVDKEDRVVIHKFRQKGENAGS